MTGRRSRRSGEARPSTAAPFQRQLVVMVKVPRAGLVKTRLAREVGVVRATSFYRHAVAAVLQRLTQPGRWQTWLAVTPDASLCSRCWPSAVPRMPQGSGDLGARMRAVMERAAPGPVVIIGSDIPAIRPAHVAAAFDALGGHDVVLGPAADGGYWLFGMKRVPRVLRPFSNVRWSSPHALSDTLANLAGRRVARMATLTDIDTAEDLRRAAATFGRRVRPIEGHERLSC
jgi:rSAM/selenodomain-associated transferase 1